MPIPPPPPSVLVRNAGTDVGSRRAINLLAGTGLSRTVTDDPTNNEVEITLALTSAANGCRVSHDANQSISDNSLTALSFNTEQYDTNAFHDTATNNSRLTVPTGLGGRYLIVGTVEWAANADANERFAGIRLNASSFLTSSSQPAINSASVTTKQVVVAIYELAAGDYVELIVRQQSGGALNALANATAAPTLALHWLAPAEDGSSSDYQQTVTVAKAGGDYTTIQAAITAIIDAAETKRYLVLVYPGKYTEQVTMKDWVDVRGIDRQSVQIEYGATTGAIIMDDNCALENLTIENSSTEGHWGIVATNKSGVHIRSVSLLAPVGSSRRGAGIKITGTSWATCFIEDVVINTYTQTNQGIFIQSDGVDLVDTTLKSCFVDALEATTGGAILIDGAEDIHLRDCYSRVASAAYCLRVIAGSVVDVTSCYFEAGTQSVEVDGSSTVWLTGTPITNSSAGAGSSLAGAGRGASTLKGGQVIGNATDTAIAYASATAQQANRNNTYWTVGTPTRLIAPHHGWYVISAGVYWAANATGDRYAHIRKNGSTWLKLTSQHAMPIGQTFIDATWAGFLAAGDYAEVVVYQSSGGNLNVDSEATIAHWF